MTAFAVVALLVLAAWLVSMPPRAVDTRIQRGWARRQAGIWSRWRARLRPKRRAKDQPLGAVLVEVAARLRSGGDVDSAWERSLPVRGGAVRGGAVRAARRRVDGARAGEAAAREVWGTDASTDGVPRALAEMAERAAGKPEAPQVAGAIAACRVAYHVGAPLADVLERCAHGLVESAEAESARRTALAGPRATARLLAWLPFVGVALGALVGADPVGVLLGGGVGGMCLVAGVALVVLGWRWVGRLVTSAERAEQAPG